MLKFFLIFNLFIILAIPLNAQDSTSVVIMDEPEIQYPGKPLIMSLVLPGAGQLYNKSPLWKTAAFVGVEVGSILSWQYFAKKAEGLQDDYESYADLNWNIANWVDNWMNPPEGIEWANFSALKKISGTHDLTLHLTGKLADEFGQFVSSDILEIHPGWVDSASVSVVKNLHYYENIGKYDQFVGGWEDVRSDWFWEEKKLEDSTELVIKTPMKVNYLDQRYVSNQMKSIAKYSITTLLFNHVFSGLEAVLTSQKKARKQQDTNEVETDLSLVYNPINRTGIGGISLTINF
jgi:hypothetical protein